MTILYRLDEKGMLARRRAGMGDVFVATLSREEYADARAPARRSVRSSTSAVRWHLCSSPSRWRAWILVAVSS